MSAYSGDTRNILCPHCQTIFAIPYEDEPGFCPECKCEPQETYDPDECRCEKCVSAEVARQEYRAEQMKEDLFTSLGRILAPGVM